MLQWHNNHNTPAATTTAVTQPLPWATACRVRTGATTKWWEMVMPPPDQTEWWDNRRWGDSKEAKLGIHMGNPQVHGTQPVPVPTDTLTHVPAGQCLQVAMGTGIVKGSPKILFVNVHYKSIQSHPTLSSSSSSPSTSAREPTAKMSESITRPLKLQDLRHINAWVDCTESWLWTWDKTRHSQLNTHSMSTDVATRNTNKHCWEHEKNGTYQELWDSLMPFTRGEDTSPNVLSTTSRHHLHPPGLYWGSRPVHHNDPFGGGLWMMEGHWRHSVAFLTILSAVDQPSKQRCNSFQTSVVLIVSLGLQRSSCL